jgi:SAM-dependent methyltransferase
LPDFTGNCAEATCDFAVVDDPETLRQPAPGVHLALNRCPTEVPGTPGRNKDHVYFVPAATVTSVIAAVVNLQKGWNVVAHRVEDHYQRLAATYERNWADRPKYVAWMADRLMAWLSPADGERIVDIGSGTGLFLGPLMETASARTPLACVDPSQPMLDLLPDDPRLLPLCATAEQIASGEVPLPWDEVDAFVFKEAIHHVQDITSTLHGFAERLGPNGRILAVSLPPRLDYPLFPAALERFARHQPEPETIVSAMDDAGLETEYRTEEYHVEIDREHWLGLVRNQWMSVLSTFDDDELTAGIEEIRQRHPEEVLTYTDRFAFIRGRKR